MNKDLFLALLAMDSYSRGYGEAIKLSGASLGGITVELRCHVQYTLFNAFYRFAPALGSGQL